MQHPKYLTRKQLVEHLKAHGYPISLSTLNKLSMATTNAGPPISCWWGCRPLYDPDAALAWAEARRSAQRGGGWRIQEEPWWADPTDAELAELDEWERSDADSV